MHTKIVGTGSYIPDNITKNDDFLGHKFLQQDGSSYDNTNEDIIDKFRKITGIVERRYMDDDMVCSDMAYEAAEKAIRDSGLDREKLDYIILAHNYGDVAKNDGNSDMVPSLATRVKYKLGIKNPGCVGYDVLFGCPGFVLGLTQADAFIKSGMAKNVLVIGSEALSRVVDPHDRDSMIYSDGAGAFVLSATEDDSQGILVNKLATYSGDEAFFIYNGKTFNADQVEDTKYIKMYGRRIYNFALQQVPAAMKSCLDEAGVDIKELDRIFIHQANEKMDEAILTRFYGLYDQEPPADVMPMNIQHHGNSSVATVPTLYDQTKRGDLDTPGVEEGDLIMFASVGAGMNVNAVLYRV